MHVRGYIDNLGLFCSILDIKDIEVIFIGLSITGNSADHSAYEPDCVILVHFVLHGFFFRGSYTPITRSKPFPCMIMLLKMTLKSNCETALHNCCMFIQVVYGVTKHMYIILWFSFCMFAVLYKVFDV